MQSREEPLAGLAVEDAAYHLERLVGIAQPVAVSQVENLAIELNCLWLFMQDNTALFLQVFVGPDIVVASEVMYLDTHVGQFGYLSEETGEAFWHHIFIFVPEVEHIAQQIDGCCLVLDRVKEVGIR